MDFSKFDFNHDCYVDLHVGDYGSLSGLFLQVNPTWLFLKSFLPILTTGKTLFSVKVDSM